MTTPLRKTYSDSIFGAAVHPWLNKADTKFNVDGLFHFGLRSNDPEAHQFASTLEAASDEYLETYLQEQAEKDPKKWTPGERKKWTPYYPFEYEEDANGDRTGYVTFNFKQNAVIKLRDGTTKDIQIGLYDAEGKEMTAPIYGGSIVRAKYAPRGIVMTSAKQAGIRLDFSMVQVKELAKGSAGGGGFGRVEGGYVEGGDTGDAPSSSEEY